MNRVNENESAFLQRRKSFPFSVYECYPITLVNADCQVYSNYILSKSRVKFTSIITDPPYGLRFMGKKWDINVPKASWSEKGYWNDHPTVKPIKLLE